MVIDHSLTICMSLQQKCGEFFEEQGGVRKKQVREIRPKLGWTKKEIEALKVSFLSSPLAFSFGLHLCFNVIKFFYFGYCTGRNSRATCLSKLSGDKDNLLDEHFEEIQRCIPSKEREQGSGGQICH